ncbi:MAG TPA: choice-of-anchor tandem repeat GloVer-containing protein [Bryobacteraceae bacterium]|nr:choice-of-anchor tandem repeat GloVer-containing protein [Bryobacteraceae bacterium]
MAKSRRRRRCISAIHWVRASRAPALLGAISVLAVIGARPAHAQKYTVLHSFSGQPMDGAAPQAALLADSDRNLYGTTFSGGASGAGVVFKVDKTGEETVLYSFTGGVDGGNPYAGLVRDSGGNLYGTTYFGGTFSSPLCVSGCGVVFKLDATGTESVLHSFTRGVDGANPYAGLLQDSAGNLYGTTTLGGESGDGVVFKLDPTGNYSVLHSFGGSSGAIPNAGVILDSEGNLYGTASAEGTGGNGCEGGGSSCGIVFKLDPAGSLTVLHSFTGGADGGNPFAGVILDEMGNLYGTTTDGGANSSCCGVLFKLDPSGTLTVLHTFTGGTDGGSPYAGLTRDAAGNLYGTATAGGVKDNGVVYKLDAAGNFSVLYSFSGATSGDKPYGGVIRGSRGNLYGTTISGGRTSAGVIFWLEP